MNATRWRAWFRQTIGLYEGLSTVAWTVALAGALLWAGALLLPATQTVTRPRPWAVVGQWHYTAAVPPSVSETGRLPLGAPLYRPLTPRVTFAFAARWEGEAPPPTALEGQARLWVRLQDEFGWQRETVLAEVPITGPRWQLKAAVNLNPITGWLRQRERVFPPARNYRLLVGVTWQAQGRLEGQPWQAQGASVLDFRRQAPNFYVLQVGTGGPDAASAAAWWAPRWEGALEVTQTVPRQVALGPWRVTVPEMRVWGLRAALAGGALWLALSGLLAWLRSRWPEVYALALLGPAAVWVEPGPWLAAVLRDAVRTSLDGLAHLARQWGEPVLVTCEAARLVAMVRLPEAAYVYEEPCPPDTPEAAAETMPPEALPQPEAARAEDQQNRAEVSHDPAEA